MKSGNKFSSTVIALLFVFLIGCDLGLTTGGKEIEEDPPKKEEVNIQIKSQPAIVEYDIANNPIFSSDGLVVEIVYSDGSKEKCTDYKLLFNNIEIQDGYDFTGTVVGYYKVLVTYHGFKAEFQLNIKNSSITAVHFVSAEIFSTPKKTTYYVGETFLTEGVSVKRYYSDNTTDFTEECSFRLASGKELYNGYVFGEYDLNPDNNYSIDVWVYYGNDALGCFGLIIFPKKEETVKKTISDVWLISFPDNWSSYRVGEAFSSQGAVIEIVYNDGTKEYTSDISLVLKYDETRRITINNGHVFEEGEEGLEENNYSVDFDFVYIDEEGKIWNLGGSSIYIMPAENEPEYVYSYTNSIEQYVVGDYFSNSDDTAEIYCDGQFYGYMALSELTYELRNVDETYKKIIEPGYQFTIEDFESQSDTSMFMVVIYYEGKSIYSYNIWISKERPKSIISSKIISEPEKTKYKPGETFTCKGLVIEVTYDDGSTEEIDKIVVYGNGKRYTEGHIFTLDDVGHLISSSLYNENGDWLNCDYSLDLYIEVENPDPDIYGIKAFGILEYPPLTVVELGNPFIPLGLTVYYTDINGNKQKTKDYGLFIRNNETGEYEPLPEKFTKAGAYEIYILYSKNTVEKFYEVSFNITVLDVEIVSDFDYEYSDETGGVIINGIKNDSDPEENPDEEDSDEYVPVYSKASDFRYEFINSTDVKITGFTENQAQEITELTIPAKIDGYNVKSVSLYLFYRLVVRNLVIEEGIEKIDLEGIPQNSFDFGSYIPKTKTITLPKGFKPFLRMFAGFKNLEEVNLPEDLEVITHHMFEYSSVKKVTGTKNVRQIDEKAFYNCKNLEEFEFGEALIDIESGAFSDCEKLKTIPDLSNIAVYESAFNNIGIEELTLTTRGIEGEQWRSGQGAIFSNCLNLKKVTIEGDVYFIGGEFIGCKNLETIVCNGTIKGNTSGIFGDCDSLTDVTVRLADDGDGYENPDRSSMFYGCDNLKNLNIILAMENNRSIFGNIPKLETVTFVYDSSVSGNPAFNTFRREVFINCPKLKTVNIPTVPSDSYTFEKSAFEGCESLVGLILPSTSNCSLAIYEYGFKNCVSLDLSFIANMNLAQLYLYNEAFSGCSNIFDMNFGTSKKIEIFPRVFEGTGITKIQFLEDVVYELSPESFFGIDLNEIVFEKNTSVLFWNYNLNPGKSSAFEPTTNISELDLSKAKEISCSFANMQNLKTVLVGNAKVFSSFMNCRKLQTITLGTNGEFLPASIANTAISTVTFRGSPNQRCNFFDNDGSVAENCPNLTKVNFENCIIPSYFFGKNGTGVVNISFKGKIGFNPYALYNCDSLTSIDITGSNAYVYDYLGEPRSDYAFAECSNLKTVVMSEEFKEALKANQGIFYNCKNLQRVETESFVTGVGDYNFYNCTNLEYVNFPDYKTTGYRINIGDTSFNFCSKILPCFKAAGQLEESMVVGLKGTGFTVNSLTWDSFSETFVGIGVKDLTLTSTMYYVPVRWAEGNEYIESLTLDGEIESKAFADCINLKTVKIGDSNFHSVRADSFDNCPLEVIYVPAKYYDEYMRSYKWAPYRALIQVY